MEARGGHRINMQRVGVWCSCDLLGKKLIIENKWTLWGQRVCVCGGGSLWGNAGGK